MSARRTTLADWHQASQTPDQVRELLCGHVASLNAEDVAWISLASPEQLEVQLLELAQRFDQLQGDLGQLPLFGVPFAVKDNIDVAGFATTAACPAFAKVAEQDATVVAKLRAAGAIVLGKTNLDQFATGLVGTRSPYGAVPNTFAADYVSGGSSSGSASVVARGLVPFALGTDTAGSGRVPAAFNNIVGLKPTKGWLSTLGVLPACRSLDCVSVFALTVDEAEQVAQLAAGFDPLDAYSRHNPNASKVGVAAVPRLAIPANPEFFQDALSAAQWQATLDELTAFGAQLTEIDFAPFSALAEQLYAGSWVAERTVAISDLLSTQPEAINPVVRGIVEGGVKFSACDAYQAEYIRAELARQIAQALEGFDALVVPTSPTIRTLAQMEQEPVLYNSQFGTYTNFTNLADLSALAVPAGFRDDGLPFGITFIAPAWHDSALAALGRRWQQHVALPLGATGVALPEARPAAVSAGAIRVAVVGAHLTGMPLNFQLTSRDAVLVEQTLTKAAYRLYALPGTVPPKPGLVRADEGSEIIVELWDVPQARFGEFVAEIPPPLGIGNVELADGRWVKGFICEPYALACARDITRFGGWRAFIAETKRLQSQGVA